jgi:hypothetical protein
MKGNYSIHHILLDIPLFEEKMSPHEHRVLFITLSYIVHWCYHEGIVHFKQGELSKDWRIKQDDFRKATKLLLKHKYIKMIKAHSQRDQTSAIYKLDKACTPWVKNLYPRRVQAVPPQGRVNNINNIIGDGATTPPPISKNETLTAPPDTIVWKNLKK